MLYRILPTVSDLVLGRAGPSRRRSGPPEPCSVAADLSAKYDVSGGETSRAVTSPKMAAGNSKKWSVLAWTNLAHIFKMKTVCWRRSVGDIIDFVLHTFSLFVFCLCCLGLIGHYDNFDEFQAPVLRSFWLVFTGSPNFTKIQLLLPNAPFLLQKRPWITKRLPFYKIPLFMPDCIFFLLEATFLWLLLAFF